MFGCYGFDDLIDGLHIDQTHQIETETVNVVFVGPVVDTVYNVLTDHAAFGSGVVAADGAAGPDALLTDTAEIGRYDLINAEGLIVVDMIINHIHDDAETIVMQCLYHLLHFLDTNFSVIRICGIGAFRDIEVYGVITPVILGLGEGFVRKAEIINRQQMNMRHPQLLNVIQTCWDTVGVDGSGFCQPQELTLVGDSGAFIHTQIPDMQFVDGSIGDALARMGITVLLPSFRIGRGQIDDHRPLTVDTGGSGIGIAGFCLFSVHGNEIGIIESVQIAVDGGAPGSVYIRDHFFLHQKIRYAGSAAGIKPDCHGLCSRSPEPETGTLVRPDGTKIGSMICILCFKFGGRIVLVHGIVLPFM